MQQVIRVIRQQFIGVTALFVALGGFAYAASGQAVLLGRPNTADKRTVMQNTGSGAALDLRAKAGQPALRVNSSTLVAKLNADTVDGKHASAFALAGFAYSKAQSDAKYVATGSSYTKAQTDAKYAAAGSSYTKAQSDARYAAAGSGYTKTEGDARYGRVLLHDTWQGTSLDGSPVSAFADQVTAPGNGTLLIVVTQSATAGSTPQERGQLYLHGVPRGGDLSASTTTDDTRMVTTAVTAAEAVALEVKVLNDAPPAQTDAEGTILVIFYADLP